MRIGGEVPGGGSILLGVSKAMSECGVPQPRIVNASPRWIVQRRSLIFKCFLSDQAVRKATPCGTSPVLTMPKCDDLQCALGLGLQALWQLVQWP
jgi:hypothetical protein